MKTEQWTVRYWVGGTKMGKWKEVLGKFTQMDAQKKMMEIQKYILITNMMKLDMI